MPDPETDNTGDVMQHEASASTLASGNITASTEAVTQLNQEREDLSVFFGIGIVVNLTMFTVLVIWGYKQWKQNDDHKK